jgi:hypothetical protein
VLQGWCSPYIGAGGSTGERQQQTITIGVNGLMPLMAGEGVKRGLIGGFKAGSKSSDLASRRSKLCGRNGQEQRGSMAHKARIKTCKTKKTAYRHDRRRCRPTRDSMDL